jgi:hypothetical protein
MLETMTGTGTMYYTGTMTGTGKAQRMPKPAKELIEAIGVGAMAAWVSEMVRGSLQTEYWMQQLPSSWRKVADTTLERFTT